MPGERSLLLVDDDPGIRDVMAYFFSRSGYQCRMAQNGREALAIFGDFRAQAVLTDIHMADMTGLEVTRQVLHLSPATAVVLMTGNADMGMAIQALRLGASDFLLKPFDFQTAHSLVQQAVARKFSFRHAEQELLRLKHQLRDLLHTSRVAAAGAVDSFCKMLEMRDVETYGHARRVTSYAGCLARKLGLSPELQEDIRLGSLLHDVGKVVVPDGILLKPEALTEEESALLQKHAEAGYSIVSGIQGLEEAAQLVLQHHEHYNGAGYPRGLRGEEICWGARIFAVADAYDAMTHDRPYRQALSDAVARQEIRRNAGIQFDPQVVRAFLQIPVGEWTQARGQPANGRKRGVAKESAKESHDPQPAMATPLTSVSPNGASLRLPLLEEAERGQL